MAFMEKNNLFYALVLVPASFFTVAANAIEPMSYTDGPLQVIPQVSTRVGYDDNIFASESNEKSSTKVIISPSVQLKAEQGLNEYSVNYVLTQGNYQDSSADNYTDHQLSGRAFFDFNIRNRLELLAGYLDTHEDRGSGLNQGLNATINDVPIEYHVNSMQGAYEFGGKDAKGRIRFVAGVQDREYDNFRTQTEVKDRQTVNTSVTFYYRVMPKTSLLFEVRNKDIDYDLSTVSLDSSERKYLLGATWDATAKTSGTVKFGYAEKDFDSALREDDDGVSWELSMRWSPKSYSVLDISTDKKAEETDGTGNYIDMTSLDLQWTHAWTDLWRSRVYYGASNSDYVSSTREDDMISYGLGVDYDVRRWLNFGLDYVYSERDSNQANLDYERNTIFLTVQGSL
ncbi:outer membrane beta-barrel protein [Neptuniibacter sp. 1_MG-2023]|jgi:hypothetical protein|uniref:outer membrane beta-barrel protein n=1 Tax=Neptuniibacter sp. 1_MG-2023 TaxID=3062662 RepID=UPI0026E42232|nr:outer membrane beta-barrel protein [Neptuniibacter sp. 1_MG-2023]MDO6592942.1 outer membrane beta-barrel protein [Neptuniibacter sp. 1_MG-2023]